MQPMPIAAGQHRRNGAVIGTATLAIGLAALAANTAAAVEEHFRIIDLRPESTSSDCIGEPKTALCAAETAMACWLRIDEEICGSINWKIDDDEETDPIENHSMQTIAYHVRNERRMEKSDIPEQYRREPHDWQAGDVAVRMTLFYCSGSMRCRAKATASPTGGPRDCPPIRCVSGGFPNLKKHLQPSQRITITRKVDGAWGIVGVYAGYPQLPSSFWKRK
jgi:hypothetical protein